MAVDEVSNCDVTLRDPWSLVEQPRRFKEGAKIDLDEFAAEAFDAPQRLAEEALAFAVAEKFQLAWARRTEPRSLDNARARAADHLAAREGVHRVESLRNGEHVASIVGGKGEDRNAIERAARGHDAAVTQKSAGRLQADDVVECRRHAAGSGGIRAEGESNQASGDGDGRPGARAARNVFCREHACRGAVRRARSVEPGRELVEVGLADRDGARVDEAPNDWRRILRDIGEIGTSGCRRMVDEIYIVLDREGDVVKRLGGKIALLQAPRMRLELVTGKPMNPDVVVASRLDPRENLVDEAQGRERPRPIARRETRQIHAVARRELSLVARPCGKIVHSQPRASLWGLRSTLHSL